MPIAHIYPSQYEATRLNVSNPSNMFTPVDSTTYATLTASPNSSYSPTLELYDFNSETIPANAVVNSFSVKLKYESNNLVVPSGYSHTARVVIWENDFDFYGDSVDLSALNTYNIPITGDDGAGIITLTPDKLKDYLICENIGDVDSGLRICITIPPPKYYSFENKVYGAEVEVDYSVPSNSKIFNLILPKGGKL